MNAMSADASERRTTVAGVFELAIHAEEQAAVLYRILAAGFSHVPGLSVFWEGLEEDEKQHGAALQLIQTSIPANELMLPADPLLIQKAQGVERVLAGVHPIVTLEDAYQTAHELEHSEVNSLFQLLANRFVSGDDRIAFYMSEIIHHQAKLTAFPQNFGGPEWRKSINMRNAEEAA